MRKLILVVAVFAIIVSSCSVSKAARGQRNLLSGSWTLDNISYQNNTGNFQSTLFCPCIRSWARPTRTFSKNISMISRAHQEIHGTRFNPQAKRKVTPEPAPHAVMIHTHNDNNQDTGRHAAS